MSNKTEELENNIAKGCGTLLGLTLGISLLALSIWWLATALVGYELAWYSALLIGLIVGLLGQQWLRNIVAVTALICLVLHYVVGLTIPFIQL